jgi:hypothetical protein
MPTPTFVYAGSYTDSKSKGIYAFRLQTENLEVSQNITLVPLGLAAETPNPSFLEVDVNRRLGDDNRKLCSLYLSIVDRFGVKLDRFGDAETRLKSL